MKKLVAIILVICLLFGGYLGYKQYKEQKENALLFEQTGYGAAAEVDIDEIDWDAIYSLYNPDKVVAKINGKDLTWGEYFYWFESYGQSIENYMYQTSLYYGETFDWDEAFEGETLLKDEPANYAKSITTQYNATYEYANLNGVVLNEESKQLVKDEVNDNLLSLAGEDATQEDIDAQLEAIHMPKGLLDKMIEGNVLYTQMFTDIYGEDCSNMKDDEVEKVLDEYPYYHMMHILFSKTDQDNVELSDSQKLELQVKADLLIEELRAVKDNQARVDKFKNFMNMHTEDPGIASFPNGYTFTQGTMVAEIEEAISKMEKYEVSDIVESSFGYHIIMRLPIDPDELIYEYYANGEPLTGREFVAEMEFDKEIQKVVDETTFEFVNGFEVPVITDFIIK